METMRFKYTSDVPTMIVIMAGSSIRYISGTKARIEKYIRLNNLRLSDILRWYIVGEIERFKLLIKRRYGLKGNIQTIETTNPDETLIELDHLYLDHMKTDRYTDFIIECLNL